jgi:hypothetical protein
VLRQSGERIVIDGPCYSACTLVLSTIPHNRVCVTRRAILGFHAPRLVDDYGREYLAPEATREVVAAYPASIRNWISRHGGLRQRPILLRGTGAHGLVSALPIDNLRSAGVRPSTGRDSCPFLAPISRSRHQWASFSREKPQCQAAQVGRVFSMNSGTPSVRSTIWGILMPSMQTRAYAPLACLSKMPFFRHVLWSFVSS